MSQTPELQPDSVAHFARLLSAAELVIFDFDGVIADSEVISLATLQEALHQYGVALTLQETRCLFLGTSLKTITEYVKQNGSRDAGTFASTWETTLFDRFRTDLKPIPRVVDLTDQLDLMGRRYCIASSSTLNRLGVALGAMGLADRLPNMFSAQQVARGKPAPDLFEFAAKEMGTPPGACLVIEDSPHGVRAATAAGMCCVGFVGGQHLNDLQAEHANLLRSAGAEMVLSSYDGLASLQRIT